MAKGEASGRQALSSRRSVTFAESSLHRPRKPGRPIILCPFRTARCGFREDPPARSIIDGRLLGGSDSVDENACNAAAGRTDESSGLRASRHAVSAASPPRWLTLAGLVVAVLLNSGCVTTEPLD